MAPFRFLLAGLIALTIARVASAELPSVDDILQIHRANRAKLSRLHLRLVQTGLFLPASFDQVKTMSFESRLYQRCNLRCLYLACEGAAHAIVFRHKCQPRYAVCRVKADTRMALKENSLPLAI